MATESKKISDTSTVTSLKGEDYLPLVRVNPDNTKTNYKIKAKDVFGAVEANSSIEANLTVVGDINFSGNNFNSTSTNVNFSNLNVSNLKVTSNNIVVTTQYTPPSSSYVEGLPAGQVKIHFDENYMYVRVSNNVIKRVALETF